MTRKHFFTTIAAILSAPFFVKSEPKKPTVEDWIKANPEIMNRILENAITNELTRRFKDRLSADEIARFYNMPITTVVKGEDIVRAFYSWK